MPSAPKGTALARQPVRVGPIRDKTNANLRRLSAITAPSAGVEAFFSEIRPRTMKDLPTPSEGE
jgi:hypothetical protein